MEKDEKRRKTSRSKKGLEIDLPIQDKVLDQIDWKNAKIALIRKLQEPIRKLLEIEKEKEEGSKKGDRESSKASPFAKLAPFKDKHEIWRVGSRVTYLPFTADNDNPILLPRLGRGTHLIMIEAHEARHSGELTTLLDFRLNGYWCKSAQSLARKVRNNCFKCNKRDPKLMRQQMGPLPKNLHASTVPWSDVQLDLLGPFYCTHGRGSIKRWAMIIVDLVTTACWTEVVEDYSSAASLMTLMDFQSTHGWPINIYTDPGSQLESSKGTLESWWSKFGKEFLILAGKQGFSWHVSPADSPWRQGLAEKMVHLTKKNLIGDKKVSTRALSSALRSCDSINNSRPISILKTPSFDGSYVIVTPNDLMLGRNSRNILIDDELVDGLKDSIIARQFKSTLAISRDFYERLAKQVSPKIVSRQKWHFEAQDELNIGDVVRILEPSALKNKWKLAKVEMVHRGEDDKIRRASLSYKIPTDLKTHKMRKVVVDRSVQRLSIVARGSEIPNIDVVEYPTSFGIQQAENT